MGSLEHPCFYGGTVRKEEILRESVERGERKTEGGRKTVQEFKSLVHSENSENSEDSDDSPSSADLYVRPATAPPVYYQSKARTLRGKNSVQCAVCSVQCALCSV